nr:hypothetical protein [Tanacetum cinerariifolium]
MIQLFSKAMLNSDTII